MKKKKEKKERTLDFIWKSFHFRVFRVVSKKGPVLKGNRNISPGKVLCDRVEDGGGAPVGSV